MSDVVITELVVSKWLECPEVIEAIERGYTKHHDPTLYVLKDSKDYILYTLDYKFYYKSEIDENYTIEQATCLCGEDIGFWASTNDPLYELKKRLQGFHQIQNNLIENLKDSTNIFGLHIDSLPTEPTDNFFNECLIAWVESVDKTLLMVPSGFVEAKEHIELLQYKYRKMVELFNSVRGLEDGLLYQKLMEL